MAKFRKDGGKKLPAVSTASLPDIIFMLLFFFMTTTSMKEVTLMVDQKMPQGTELKKLEKKSLVSYIYIGVPIEERKFGSATRFQLNDQFGEISDIATFIESERAARDEADKPFLTTTIKCDKEVKMGDVTDVKQELRKVGALRIMYAASRRVKDTY